ncbi:MAG: DNA methyltransferase [Candidatus Binataceae bacterium]
MEALRKTRLLRSICPRELGGDETDPVTLLEVFEALARVDASASWVVGILAYSSAFAGAFLPGRSAQRIFVNSVPPMAGLLAPRGLAEPVDGGYRVKGRWAYGSGIHHADWVLAGALIPGRPPIDAGRVIVLPRDQVVIHDNWQVAGLKASGSSDYSIENRFVADETQNDTLPDEVFCEVRRVLRDDGVLWLVLGDSYWGTNCRGTRGLGAKQTSNRGSAAAQRSLAASRHYHHVLKRKDLIGIPWRVALALQADGWHLRADVIWSKPNPMPEPVLDRPTRSHECVFLLTKRRRYFYDAGAIAEQALSDHPSGNHFVRPHRLSWGNRGNSTFWNDVGGKRNRRDVWQLPSEPTTDAHYATFPAELAKLCIPAGSRLGDLVLDPFLGSGTTGTVASYCASSRGVFDYAGFPDARNRVPGRFNGN